MSLAAWIDKHPFLTFLLAGSAISGVAAIATAPFKATAQTAQPQTATSFTPGHRYQMLESIGPSTMPNTVVQAQTAIDARMGPGVFHIESIAQHGNQLVTTLVYTGTVPLPLGAVIAVLPAGAKLLDLGPA